MGDQHKLSGTARQEIAALLLGVTYTKSGAKRSPRSELTTRIHCPKLNEEVRRASGQDTQWTDEHTWELVKSVLKDPEALSHGSLGARHLLAIDDEYPDNTILPGSPMTIGEVREIVEKRYSKPSRGNKFRHLEFKTSNMLRKSAVARMFNGTVEGYFKILPGGNWSHGLNLVTSPFIDAIEAKLTLANFDECMQVMRELEDRVQDEVVAVEDRYLGSVSLEGGFARRLVQLTSGQGVPLVERYVESPTLFLAAYDETVYEVFAEMAGGKALQVRTTLTNLVHSPDIEKFPSTKLIDREDYRQAVEKAQKDGLGEISPLLMVMKFLEGSSRTSEAILGLIDVPLGVVVSRLIKAMESLSAYDSPELDSWIFKQSK